MSAQKKRKPNFSESELLNFLKILETRRTLVNGESNLFGEALVGAWNEVADEFTAIAAFPRSGEELRNKFTDLKSRTKKRLTEIKNDQQETGGGPPQQLKPYEEIVVQLAGHNSMYGFNCYIDAFNDTPIVNVDHEPEAESVAPQRSEVPSTSGHPRQSSNTSSRKPNHLRNKRRSREIEDDFDRQMLAITKRNIIIQDQQLEEAKITNVLRKQGLEEAKLANNLQNKRLEELKATNEILRDIAERIPVYLRDN